MAYAEIMRASTNGWASAYLQFETGYRREGFLAYVFVEDEDDIVFYQHALSNATNVSFLGCGGRTGVISIYKKTKSESRSDGNLYIIDKDTELEPFQYEEILRTSGYSWESHVCDPAIVRYILQRRLTPSLQISEAEQVEEEWKSTVETFREHLAAHTALLRTAFQLDKSLELSSNAICSGVVSNGRFLAPGQSWNEWYEKGYELATSLGAKSSEIDASLKRYLKSDLIVTARGKELVTLLRAFIRHTLKLKARTYIGEYNSAKHLASAIPCNHASLDYIKKYYLRRTSKSSGM